MKTIDLKISDFLLYLTWLYSVHFIGAIPNNINSIFSIILILLPSLILIYLSKLFKNESFKYNFNVKFLIYFFIISTIFILINFNSNTLFNDESSYALGSYKLAHGFILKASEFFPWFNKFNFKIALRLINLIILILPFVLIFYSKIKNKILIGSILIVIIRLLLTFILDGSTGTHPPMHSFLSSTITTLFGINSFTFRIAQLIPLILLLTYFLIETETKKITLLILALAISLDPFIGFFALVVEQSNYSFIFISFLFFTVLYKKIDLKYISLIIGISLLFRNTLISLFFIPFIVQFYKSTKFDKKFIVNFSPILIGIPTFLKSIIYGTPSTIKMNNLDFETQLNGITDLDILYNLSNVLDFYILIPILLITYFVIKKRYDIVLMILSYFIIYIMLHVFAHAPKYFSKYYFEFVGFSFLLFYFIYFKNLNIDKNKFYLILFIPLIFLRLEFNKNLEQKNLIDLTIRNENFHPTLILENDAEIVLRQVNNDLKNTILISSDDKSLLPFIFLNKTIKQTNIDYSLTKTYNQLNSNLNNGKMYYKISIDYDLINKLSNDIKYIIFTDLSEITNKIKIDNLIKDGWEVYKSKKKSKSHFGWLILYNKEFKKV